MKSTKSAALIDAANRYLLPNYRPLPVVMEKGVGALLYDVDGKEYIDLVAGIAVSSLGHGNREIAEAISFQSQKLIHSSNTLLHEPGIELARLLCETSGMQRVFFCNSGAEANEAMLKLARRVYSTRSPERTEIICMTKAFHGRTLGCISATGQEKYRDGFGPLLPGFQSIAFGDIAALKAAINPNTAAVILEPILGEGGIITPPSGYLSQVRAICDSENILMLLDEVQTGVGRTGMMFACQHEGVLPDAMAVAKGLGGGVPIGAMLVREKYAQVLNFPSHGSTFGGNPVACAAASVVIKTVSDAAFLTNVERLAKILFDRLVEIKGRFPEVIQEIRGKGLLMGVQFKMDPLDFTARAAECGVILNFCGEKVLRIAPPLVITQEQLERALNIIEELLHDRR